MKKLLLASYLKMFEPKIDDLFDMPLSNMHVVCIPTAAYGEDGALDWLDGEESIIRDRVKSFEEFDIAEKTEDQVFAALKKADLIFVTGGNTYYLLQHAKHCNLDKVLEKCFASGAYYLGVSAGAILPCPRIDHIADMDDPSKANLANFKGLNLIDFLVMPHIDHEKYGSKAKTIINELKSKNTPVIGLRDDQALYIQDNYIEIY